MSGLNCHSDGKGQTMKAVIYARVSTKEQSEKGYGLDYQIEDCRQYAKHSGLDVIGVIQDDISGATRIEDRAGGRKLLDFVEDGRVGAVVVWRLDRLAQSWDCRSSTSGRDKNGPIRAERRTDVWPTCEVRKGSWRAEYGHA